MNIVDKVQKILLGESVVMTDEEMDILDEKAETLDYVSVPNPQRVGTKDKWKVYLNPHTKIEAGETA